MRDVSRWASRVTPLVAVFIVLAAGSAWAGETQTPPTDPPEARMQPPGGVATQAHMQPPVGIAPPPPPDGTSQARLDPPVGGQWRLQPPVGVTLMETILMWLQSRLSIPHG
jgi:hypothetical protein